MAKKIDDFIKDRTYLSPAQIIQVIHDVVVHNYTLAQKAKAAGSNPADASYIVPMIWGSPGIGKTVCVKTGAMKASTTLGFDVPVIVEPIADKSPEEIAGYPRPASEDTFRRLMPQHWFEHRDRPVLGFFDEIAQGNIEQMNVARGALLGQKIGELTLHPGSTIVGASNLMEDRAGTHVMPTHVKSVLMHLFMRTDHKEWANWAMANGVAPEITSFIYVLGMEWLHSLDTASTTLACPDPRSWEKASSIYKMNIADDLKVAMISGTVGKSACGALYAHIEHGKHMPDTDAILEGKHVKWDESRSAVMYMTMCTLATKVSKESMHNLVGFIQNMKSKEFGSFCMNMCLQRDKSLRNNASVTKWMIENEVDLIL
jgi:hypothetical protein